MSISPFYDKHKRLQKNGFFYVRFWTLAKKNQIPMHYRRIIERLSKIYARAMYSLYNTSIFGKATDSNSAAAMVNKNITLCQASFSCDYVSNVMGNDN